MMNLTVSLQSNLIHLLDTSQTLGLCTGYSMSNETLAKAQTTYHTSRLAVLVDTLLVDFESRRCRLLDVGAQSALLQ